MDKNDKVLQCSSNAEVEQIIVDNMGLVYKQLHKFNLGYDSEAYSLGLLGLYKAVLTYSDATKATFSTYASVCIYNNVCGYLRKLNTLKVKSTVSYDAILSDGETSLLEFLEDPKRVEDEYISGEGVSYIKKFIKEYYDSETNEIRKQILKIWIDHNFEISNKDIAAMVQCSGSYVSRVVVQFRKELKDYLKEVYKYDKGNRII